MFLNEKSLMSCIKLAIDCNYDHTRVWSLVRIHKDFNNLAPQARNKINKVLGYCALWNGGETGEEKRAAHSFLVEEINSLTSMLNESPQSFVV